MSSTPAGWYPDGQGAQRYWDGTAWTERTRPLDARDDGPGSGVPAPTDDPHAEPTRLAGSPLPPGLGGPGGSGAGGAGGAGSQQAPQQQPGQPSSGGYGQAPSGQQGGYGAPQGGYGGAPQGGYGAPQGGYSQPGGYPQAGGGYPQQGGFPGGPGFPGTPAKKSKLPLILGLGGGGLLVVIIVIVLLVVFVGGSSNSPSGVAKDFFNKAKDHDCAAFDDVSTKGGTKLPGGQSIKDYCNAHKDEIFSTDGGGNDCQDSSISTSDEKIDGDTATVKIKVTGGGSDCAESDTISLVKEDGKWKIDPTSIQ